MSERGYGTLTITDVVDGAQIWTTTTAPTTPNYTFTISNLSGDDNATIKDGDIILYSYYRYTVTSVGETTVLAGTRTSIRGATGAPGLNNATVTLYKRAVASPVKPSAELTYTFATGKLSGNLDNWSQEIPSGTDPVWTIIATASSNTVDDTIPASEWQGPVQILENGADGYNQATIYLYQKASYIPDKPSVASSYTFSSGDLSPVPSGWSRTIPDGTVADDTPYKFRRTANGQPVGKSLTLNKIIGGTVAWNQLARPFESTYYSQVSTGSSYTLSETELVVTVTGETSTGTIGTQSAYRTTFPANHVLLTVFEAKQNRDLANAYSASPDATTVGGTQRYQYDIFDGAPVGEWFAKAYMIKRESNITNFGVRFAAISSSPLAQGDEVSIRNLMSFDLTAMFGTAIADYIYGLETATAGAGVALFKSMFNAGYYEYSDKELKSIEGLSAHVTTGFNQFDKADIGIVPDKFLTVTGEYGSSTNYKVTGYIKVVPGSQYYIYPTTGQNPCVVFYTDNKDFISSVKYSNETAKLVTASDNARYMRASYHVDNENGFCVNLSDPSRNGTYESYEEHTYSLDNSLALRGVPTISAGKINFDGDVYAPDGTVTRRYGIVDLGTLSWQYLTNYGEPFFRATFDSRYYGASTAGVCDKYPFGANNVSLTTIGDASSPDKTLYYQGANSGVCIKDSFYTDAATFKAAMSGVYLVYELATPTTETANTYINPQIVDASGTEEFISTSIVPVGHETQYSEAPCYVTTAAAIGQTAIVNIPVSAWADVVKMSEVGTSGADGVSVVNVTSTNNTQDGGTSVITITLSDGSTKTFNVKNGNTGSTAEWFYGTALTHTSGSATATIDGAVVGSMYLNVDTTLIYKCTAISGTTMTWTYAGNLTTGVLENIDIGGRNLLLGTSVEKTATCPASTTNGATSAYYKWSDFGKAWIQGSEAGDLYAVSFDVEQTGDSTAGYFYCQVNATQCSAADGKSVNIAWAESQQSFHVSRIFKLTTAQITNTTQAGFRIRLSETSGAGSAIVTIRNVKIEKGNTSTDWTPAPEDTDDVIATAQSTADNANRAVSDLKEDTKSGFNSLGQRIDATDANYSTLNAKFDGLNGEYRITFKQVATNTSSIANEATERQKLIRFTNGAIAIGQSDSDFSMRLTNEMLGFYQGYKEEEGVENVPISYFGNNTMYITNANIGTSLQIGNFIFVPRANGSLDFKLAN